MTSLVSSFFPFKSRSKEDDSPMSGCPPTVHCWLVRAYLALLSIAFHCLLDQQLGQQCFEGFELINLKNGFTTLPLGGGGWTKLISLAATFVPTGVKH